MIDRRLQLSKLGAIRSDANTPAPHPIIFSDGMVRAILEGRKTQTRRIVKPQPSKYLTTTEKLLCRYGVPGDTLWVKENFAEHPEDGEGYVYKATDPDWDEMQGWRWRSSRYMPRAASRITLRVKAVRLERLQYITKADALAEGFYKLEQKELSPWFGCGALDKHKRIIRGLTPEMAFQLLWDSIHGDDAWKRNDFVWVVTFSRVAQEANDDH